MRIALIALIYAATALSWTLTIYFLLGCANELARWWSKL